LARQQGLTQELSTNAATAEQTFREFSVILQGHLAAYCRRVEGVKLFVFLLSPYRLIGTCNSGLMSHDAA
jgi:hypothetical protein